MSHNAPMFHVSKRDDLPWYQAWAIRGGAILLSLLACAIITMPITGENPISIYLTILQGSFGSGRRVWMLLQNMAILLCVSLALTPAFKMQFWNIGGEGQMLMGGLGAASCMILLGDKLPNGALIVLMLAASLLLGAVWAFFPAIFKARWGTNETLFTLMMNYIASQIVAFFIILWEVPKGAGKIGIINQTSQAGWLPVVGGQKYLLNVIVVSTLCVLMHIYLKYSKHGYEISVVGESERTARYVGIKVERVIVRTMLLSGALCGLAGLLLVAGTDHTLTTTITGGRGFTAVMVSWMAKFRPAWMVAVCFLLVFMQRGAGQISTTFGLSQSYADILTGIILFFLIGSEFFVEYRIDLVNKGGQHHV